MRRPDPHRGRASAVLAILTGVTLIAFASNSVLCRMALGGHRIDPVSFTTLRLASGAAMLAALARLTAAPRATGTPMGSWASAIALFTYAVAFSLALVSLTAGMGALVLFSAVQATMIGGGVLAGERPRRIQWMGLAVALAGLVYLVSPGLTAPDPAGVALMTLAGAAWGVYSLRGKQSTAPVPTNAGNFARTVPLALAASLLAVRGARAEWSGVALALGSGAIASALGYVLWYHVLRGLTRTQAAIVQLLVPVLAATGGVLLLGEQPSARLAVASVLILGGVAFAVLARAVRPVAEPPNAKPEPPAA